MRAGLVAEEEARLGTRRPLCGKWRPCILHPSLEAEALRHRSTLPLSTSPCWDRALIGLPPQPTESRRWELQELGNTLTSTHLVLHYRVFIKLKSTIVRPRHGSVWVSPWLGTNNRRRMEATWKTIRTPQLHLTNIEKRSWNAKNVCFSAARWSFTEPRHPSSPKSWLVFTGHALCRFKDSYGACCLGLCIFFRSF